MKVHVILMISILLLFRSQSSLPNRELLAGISYSGVKNEHSPLLHGSSSIHQKVDVVPGKKPSFVRALASVYGMTLLEVQLCRLVFDALTFAGPLLQQLVLFCLLDV